MYNDPDRFTARTVFQSSMDIFMAILSMVIPALLTRMSILPCSSRTSWTTRWQSSGRASVHQGNVSRPEDCHRVVQEVLDEHGRIDILVNNAGITMDKMAMKMSIEDWNTVLAVNLSGSFYMAQPVLEHMVERGTGRIIFVSSVIGETGNIGQANYAASKAGLLGLTKTLAKEAALDAA